MISAATTARFYFPRRRSLPNSLFACLGVASERKRDAKTDRPYSRRACSYFGHSKECPLFYSSIGTGMVILTKRKESRVVAGFS